MIEKDVSVAHADGAESAMIFNEVLSSEAEIDSIVGRPNSRVLAKVTNRLDDLCREFIGASPFLVVSSSDSQGRMDCSPKGDPAGFVQVLDDWTLAIPERPGNRRADTFRNVLQNPKVGLVFLVPGKGETLRINGTARIVRDSWLREKLAHKGIVPQLALVSRRCLRIARNAWCAQNSGSLNLGSPRACSSPLHRQWSHTENSNSRFRKCKPSRMNGCEPVFIRMRTRKSWLAGMSPYGLLRTS